MDNSKILIAALIIGWFGSSALHAADESVVMQPLQIVSGGIRDHAKNVLVNEASQGPVMLINLKPGNYTLVSAVQGDSKTQNIIASSHGLHTYDIYLHLTES